ncbi:MAG: glycogen synthase [Chloroflexi bacterium]|nr:glycogen synthase [Chloroflexota bacterium]
MRAALYRFSHGRKRAIRLPGSMAMQRGPGVYHAVVPMRVAFLAAECEPWAKTGGLADVVDALARALGEVAAGELELPIDVFLPRYRSVVVPVGSLTGERFVEVPGGGGAGGTGMTRVRIVDVAADGYRLRLVDHPASFDREGGYYGDATGDFPDNAARFALFCRAALAVLEAEGRPPDVLHLHDWHAAPAVRYRELGRAAPPAILLTVHNLAYHGWTPRAAVGQLGPEWTAGLGRRAAGIDLLGEAIDRADLVNTVSPGFAREALTPEFGMGLDARLRARGDAFFGILNGLDTDLWDPATDPVLAATFSAADRTGKRACRADLLARVGFDPVDEGPVVGMIGRLDPQKGFDLLAEAAPALLADGFRLIVQGSGPAELVGSLRGLAVDRPDRVALIERFDRDMARRIYAGADGFLMPSRFEPCGTGQMVALRYGTPPIVHATGGLRDTVRDEHDQPGDGTGFVFRHPTAVGLRWACETFRTMFEAGGSAWESLLDRGMAVDFDWRTHSAPAYIEAYRRAMALRAGASAPSPTPPVRRTRP